MGERTKLTDDSIPGGVRSAQPADANEADLLKAYFHDVLLSRADGESDSLLMLMMLASPWS